MSKLPKKYKEIERMFRKKGLRLDDYEEYYNGEWEDEDED
jgi:hypothetical protein